MTTPIRVGDELRFTGTIARGAVAGEQSVRVLFAGANYSVDVEISAVVAAERLPRKLAVGDRVQEKLRLHNPAYAKIVAIYEGYAGVGWEDSGCLGWLPLSDLRLSDDGEGK